jgi:hypothetical protein
MTQPSGRFHRWICLCPSPVLAGSTRSRSVRCRFHTCRPIYRGFARIDATVRNVHAVPGPVRIPGRVGSGRARDAGVVQRPESAYTVKALSVRPLPPPILIPA